MKKRKYSKKEIKRYSQALDYIRDELITGRHIIACLGSAGFPFNNDVNRLCHFASLTHPDIAEEIRKHCNFITV